MEELHARHKLALIATHEYVAGGVKAFCTAAGNDGRPRSNCSYSAVLTDGGYFLIVCNPLHCGCIAGYELGAEGLGIPYRHEQALGVEQHPVYVYVLCAAGQKHECCSEEIADSHTAKISFFIIFVDLTD